MKLDCAGLAQPAVAACSEDGDSRAAVLGAAIRLAATRAGVESFDAVVYVGDQPWDLEAALQAGAGFVGIDARAPEGHLRRIGARVVDDYLDHPRFVRELALAAGAAAPRAGAVVTPDAGLATSAFRTPREP